MRIVEEDFEVLREPLESGRQSRESISVVLILGIFLQALMFALNYYLAAPYSLFPFKEEIINIHFFLVYCCFNRVKYCVLYPVCL